MLFIIVRMTCPQELKGGVSKKFTAEKYTMKMKGGTLTFTNPKAKLSLTSENDITFLALISSVYLTEANGSLLIRVINDTVVFFFVFCENSKRQAFIFICCPRHMH